MTITRNEFEQRLNQIFDSRRYFTNEDAIEMLYTNDGNRLPWMNTIRSNLQSLINGYLAQYDLAVTDAQKDAVVGSVANTYSPPSCPSKNPNKYFMRQIL